MSDTIGRISVPALVDSGLTFPLTSDFGYCFSQERPVVVHQFGELDANASSCDYYFDSANGCRAQGMSQYFGGHPAEPQGVVIKDDSTALWGFGRSTVTATSIISDSIWGNALQEIWCNDDGDPGTAFWVNCMIAAGRDESDFYDALGIVGAGPISSYGFGASSTPHVFEIYNTNGGAGTGAIGSTDHVGLTSDDAGRHRHHLRSGLPASNTP